MTLDKSSARELIVRAHHTALCVNDFDAAKLFFTDFVGMELEWEFDRRDEAALSQVTELPGAAASMAMLRLGDYRLELFKYHCPESHRAPQLQCDQGYTHMAFEVSDVDAIHARLLEAGYRTSTPPVSLRPGYSKLVYAYAPENAVIEFIEFLGKDVSARLAAHG